MLQGYISIAQAWHKIYVEKLSTEELEKEVARLKSKLNQSNIEEIYKDNEMMKKELLSMHILLDENDDLRSEVARLQAMSYEDRVKLIGEENA